MFKKILNGETKTITSAAVIIGAAALISRLLGVLRDRVLAGEFGAGQTLDIYYASFRIPDLVFNLVVLGAISAGFIPVFSGLLKRDKISGIIPGVQKQAWQLVSNLLNLLLLVLIGICGLLIIITPGLMKLLVPGFSQEAFNQVVAMSRIMFLSPILLGISAILGGVLQTFKRFFIYSLAPIMYNVGIILGALYLVNWLGIYGLAWGVVLGAGFHLLVQLGAVFDLGWRPQFLINLKDKNVRQILKMMMPRTLALATMQINLMVVTIIGSTLAAGSIAVFNLANNLQYFPLGIFGISYAVAAFPTLSELVAKKKEFVASFSATLRQILFFIIPASSLLIILRAQIVRVILGTGRFDWADTIATMDTLAFFAIGLFAQSLIPLLNRVFYVRRNSLTPFLAGLISAGLNVALCLVLVRYLDVAGLALAFSIAAVINLSILWVILHLQLKNLDEPRILFSVVKISLAALLMSLVVQVGKYVVEPLVGTQTFLGIFTQGAIAGCVGLLVYVLVCFLLQSPELLAFGNSIRRRLFKRYKPWEVVE